MRVQCLEYFLEVAKTGSITHAANKLFISQQGLSRIIQNIEQRFEIRLFDRNNNILTLTAEGQKFAEEAVKVTTAYKQLQVFAASCGELPQPEDKYIKVITTPFILTVLFPLLEDFLDASPFKDILRISEKSMSEISFNIPSISDHGVYIISIPDYAIEHINNTVGNFEPLISTEIMLLAHNHSPIASKDIIENDEICSLPLIYYHEDLLEDVLQHLCEDVGKNDQHLKVSDVHRIMQKVKQNKAVTVTDSLSVFLYEMSEELSAVPIKESVSLVIGILTKPDVNKTANELAFIEFFKKSLRVLCGPYLKQSPHIF